MATPLANRLPRKPQRKCIFCGQGGTFGNKMSEEHLWPEWMHPYLLPYVLDHHTRASRFRQQPNGVLSEDKIRQGHIFKKRFKFVCQNCNSGWMSGIENDAKPILVPLLEGRRIVVLMSMRRTLAQWLSLKLMLTDCIGAEPVLHQQERARFKIENKIPDRLKIWIGTHSSPDWYAQYSRHKLSATYIPRGAPARNQSGILENMELTAIGIGHLFTVFYVSGIPIPLKAKSGVRSLWPLQTRGFSGPFPSFPRLTVTGSLLA